ncbi:hypothetical protein Tco_0992266 [Tanacetum coccineum]|uniref:Uncharacterized protein n=1 Tax=Tanacetum coccineum TaxID=301880 RepID=A0ABQ5F1X2_9ASTR
MTTPRPTPFPATTPRAWVFTVFVIISDSDDEITTLPVRPAPPSPDRTPALYGYPLDSALKTYTRYKTLLNELTNDGVILFKHEINVGFMNSLLEKWLSFSYGLRNANHTQTFDLDDIYGRFVYEDNLISKRYPETKKALITAPSISPISTTFFSYNIVQDFQENSDDEANERSSEEYLRD